MKKIFMLLFICSLSFSVNAATRYKIETSYNNEFFIINGEKYKAKTYCFGWYDRDEVIFLNGSANGVCTSATLYNVNREKTCEVWCE